MKKLIIFLVFISLFSNINAQVPRTEKGTSGFQVGLLGGYVYHEFGLNTDIALRAELGLRFSGSYSTMQGFQYILSPIIVLEPRYYYNFTKRSHKGKNTHFNAANFLALSIWYMPNTSLATNMEELDMTTGLAIIPMWGIRRNVGSRFNFETGGGPGLIFNVWDNDLVVDYGFRIFLRFGIKFGGADRKGTN